MSRREDQPNPYLRGAVVAVIVLMAALAVLIALSGCGGSAPVKGTDTASGTLTLQTTSLTRLSATECEGSGGYSDIQEGAQVVISDSAGKTLALGQLSAGDVQPGACEFTFKVPVPAGQGFYQVEITHRGKVQFSEDQLDSIRVTLGSK